MIETLFAPMLATYAKGAPIAAGTATSDSASRPTRIPERRFLPENRLGSGALVFMPCDSAASMPAPRTDTASGCLREVSREVGSERRDGTAATAEFRQFRKFDRKFTTGPFRLFQTYSSPPQNRSTTKSQPARSRALRRNARSQPPREFRGTPKTRRAIRPENLASTETRQAGAEGMSRTPKPAKQDAERISR